ncbi:hypothetical protein IFM89_013353, partial [Coptis chinensis]
ITSLLSPHSFLKCRPPLFSSHSSPFSSHTCQQTRSIRNLKTTLVHAKLGSSGREEVGEEGLEEVFFGMDDDIEEESDNEDDEETESSLDLLFRFLQSLFKKVSRKAKKATRSILPPIIAPQLADITTAYDHISRALLDSLEEDGFRWQMECIDTYLHLYSLLSVLLMAHKLNSLKASVVLGRATCCLLVSLAL